MVAIISMCVALSALFIANMCMIAMIGEINRKTAESEQTSYVGFGFLKVLRIFEEYRRLYPTGRLHVYALLSFSLGVIALFVVAVHLVVGE